MSWLRTLRRFLRIGSSGSEVVPIESTKVTAPKPAATATPEPAEVPPPDPTETVASAPTETPTLKSTQATASEPSELTIPERTLPTTVVVVGLDFGTSGTKVVVRRLDKGRLGSAVDFGTVLTGFSRFSFPSTVTLDDSRLLFGDDAERHQKGIVFRSLKRTLLSTDGDVRHAASPESPPPPQDLAAYPHFLVAAYLGSVLRRVRDLVAQEYGEDSEVYYNLDIPVSQLDGGSIQKKFQTAFDAAVDFAETTDLRVDDYKSLWNRWLYVLSQPSTGSADLEYKRWELIPESSAIVKGAEAALASILPDSRRYTAIVDIGAGTTDVGWFRWVTPEQGDRLYFFSAKTGLVGCDDVDDKLLDILAVSDNDRLRLVPIVRAAKSELDGDQCVEVGKGYRFLHSNDLSRAVEQVAGRCFNEYRDSFGEAYQKDKNTDHWENIRVILVGGGSQLIGFRTQLCRHPMRSFGRDVDMLLPGSSASVGSTVRTLGAIGATSKPPGGDDIVFLLPALGLSYPALEIPEPGLPEDIPSSPPPPRGPTGLYDYDPDDG